jgi:UDP-N-acetyl-D-galactosamine dehydrogenase
MAPSIKVAEAAKVIENTQRDVNIALINEFALIFHRLGIDTHDELAAAVTKWNFLPFKPGLVGGHCIGVDPYYLIQRALSAGYYPDVLMACRRINEGMGKQVVAEIIKLMIGKDLLVKGGRALILGLSFKENCPDLRNTRVVDLIHELQSFGLLVDVHDPWVDPIEAMHDYSLNLLPELPAQDDYQAVVLAVGHEQYRVLCAKAIRALMAPEGVIYDIKGLFPKALVDARL